MKRKPYRTRHMFPEVTLKTTNKEGYRLYMRLYMRNQKGIPKSAFRKPIENELRRINQNINV